MEQQTLNQQILLLLFYYYKCGAVTSVGWQVILCDPIDK